MGRISEAIKNFNQEQIQSFLKNGYEHISINGHEFRLDAEDVEISSLARDGYVAQSDRSITVALNTKLSPELKEEGFAREFINRVQNFRKDAGFEVTDHIVIQVQNLEKKEVDALNRQKTYICNETLADEIQFDIFQAELRDEIKIDSFTFMIGLLKK